nr:GntR family transcriptional regulator [Bacilli bacterium]
MSTRSILYEKIYDHLKQQITDGHFQPGDLLPTEQELMSQFRVSRMTTNRALQLLTNEGLIVRKAGIGTFVAQSESLLPLSAEDNPFQSSAFDSILSTEITRGITQIGFVIPFLDQSFGPALLAEVERQLHAEPFVLNVGCSYGSQQVEQEIIDRLVSSGVQGLIVMPVNGEYYNPAILKLHVEQFPIVLVDKQLSGIPVSYITTDNTLAARTLTEHLLALDHSSIAYFSPDWQGTSTLADRRKGFEEAIANAKDDSLTIIDVPVVTWEKMIDHFDERQLDIVTNTLVDHPKITAVFATDDKLADYWLEAARRLNIRVPEDFSIVCFDGPLPKPPHFSMTCALQDQEFMAKEAVRIVLQQLRDTQPYTPEMIIVPASIHIGNSTSRCHHG